MGSSAENLSPEFTRLFFQRAGDRGLLGFADFMNFVLYDETIGYYRRARPRVGAAPETDFYTSSSFKEAFGGAVEAAAVKLLGPAEPQRYTFVEIGAEPGAALLDGLVHRFDQLECFSYGVPPLLPPQAVVFSNELFDALPFHRVFFADGQWREWGVRLSRGRLGWEPLPVLSEPVAAAAHLLPSAPPAGYTIDLPLATRRLVRSLAEQDWRGLFLAFDYGKSWHEIAHERPEGTARAYYHHQQSNDLLAHPGEQDLTCHICWDWLGEELRSCGFETVRLESQEAFILRNAADFVRDMVNRHPDPLSRMRSHIKQLIHPSLMGQKFQVLIAARPES